MIKEIANLVHDLDEMRSHGIKPREGLHILIGIDEAGNIEVKRVEIFRKKDNPELEFWKLCAAFEQNAWCINTDKCLDLPAKGIQSASPYCFGLKKDSLIGGQKFHKDKIKVYDRLEQYFANAIKFLNDEGEKKNAVLFKDFCKRYLTTKIATTEHFTALKDSEYIIMHLDIPLDVYQKPHQQYLKRRLFNTDQYNVPGEAGEVFGTSNFFSGYNSKKPFLMHKTAPFDINGRISGSEAQALFQFEQMLARGVLPNPIPIFIHKEELNVSMIKLFNDEEQKIGYREIIQSIPQEDRQNYYLLFSSRGEIKDFDFVTKFDYGLIDEKSGDPFWSIYNLFHLKEKSSKEDLRYPPIKNVFQFQGQVVQPIFNRALVKEDSGKLIIKYFDDIDPKYCSATTYLLVMKYRQAFYNFIYKSRREAVTGLIFKDIMQSGILDDLKNNKEYGVREKLNIYFSLNHHFNINNSNFIGNYMPDKLDQLFQKTMEIADSKERVAVTDETEFAYVSGQMINFLLDQSESANATHAMLEPFLQKANRELFVEEIVRTFNRYKHNIDRNGTGRVSRLMREILGFDKSIEIKKYMPFILAGYFSPSFRFTKSLENTSATTEQ